jgi:hypothetical protein
VELESVRETDKLPKRRSLHPVNVAVAEREQVLQLIKAAGAPVGQHFLQIDPPTRLGRVSKDARPRKVKKKIRKEEKNKEFLSFFFVLFFY